MTTREKIIVGMMCLTIAYGAYELLSSGPDKKQAAVPAANQPNDELHDFVTKISKKLIDKNSERNNQNLISMAASEVVKDPFIQSIQPLKAKPGNEAQQEKPKSAEDKQPGFSYTGFMQVGQTKLAIIDGLEYSEGDAIGASDYYVRSISAQQVIISQVNGSKTIRLTLQESAN